MKEFHTISFIVKNNKGSFCEIIKETWNGNYRYINLPEDKIAIDENLGNKIVSYENRTDTNFDNFSDNGKNIRFNYYRKHKDKLLKEFIYYDFIIGRACCIPKDRFIKRCHNIRYEEVSKNCDLITILKNMPYEESIEFLKDRFKRC